MCLGIPAQIVELVDSEAGIAKAEISGVRRDDLDRALPRGRRRRLGARARRVRARDDRRGAGEGDAGAARADGRGVRAGGRRDPGERRRMSLDVEHCITCGDVAVTATVVSVSGDTATVEVDGRREQVGIELVSPVEPGEAAALPRRHRAAEDGGRVRFVDEYRSGELAREAVARDRVAGRARPRGADHGGLRRTHARDLEARARGSCPGRGRLPARPRLPGLRDPDGPGRRRDLPRRAARGHVHDLRGHGARPRRPRLAARGQGARRRRAHGLLAAGRARARTREPRHEIVFFAIGFETTAPATALTLLRAREAGRAQLQRLLQPRHDRAAAEGDPRLARPAARRVHRARSRLDRDRHAHVRLHRPRLRTARRRHGLRAARHPAGGRHGPPPASRRALRGREPVHARRAPRRQPAGDRGDRGDHGAAARRSSGAASAGSSGAGCACGRSSPTGTPRRGSSSPGTASRIPKACQCGEVLVGAIKPWECKVFGTACTPERPIGTCMVSRRGRLRRLLQLRAPGA